jgi:hypothetical protein
MNEMKFLPQQQNWKAEGSGTSSELPGTQELKNIGITINPGKGSGSTQPPRPRSRQTGGGDDEFKRVIRMLVGIRMTLRRLVRMKNPILPRELHLPISKSWPAAETGFHTAIMALRDKRQRETLRIYLVQNGFTGVMLDMKETSLNYHMRQVQEQVSKHEKKQSKVEKFLKWLKPGFKVMNSILGSLSAIPGVDVVKEYKEHVEAGYEVTEASQ